MVGNLMAIVASKKGLKSKSLKVVAKDNEWIKLAVSYNQLKGWCSWQSCSQEKITSSITQNTYLKETLQNCMVIRPEEITITCIDEGVQYFGANHSTIQISLPGTGILMENKIDSIIENISDIIKNNPIKKIHVTSHSNCGAACLATRNRMKRLSGHRIRIFADRVSDSVGQLFSYQFANRLREEYKETSITIKGKHIQNIERPDFHNACGAIINFIPQLNMGLFQKKIGLPMFSISGFMIEEDEILEEILLSYEIAIGEHGFASRFCKNTPFELIATTQREDDHIRMQNVFAKMSSKLPEGTPIAFSVVKI